MPSDGNASHDIRSTRRDDAVIQAEARRVAGTLRSYGVLPRETLERLCKAEQWHDGGFDIALAAAVRSGEIEPVGEGFYRARAEEHGSAA